MISHLHITNYALIRDIEFAPTAGFNIITGETGAGKSIILGAISLLRGTRADMRAVSNPDSKSVVEAVFAVSPATSALIEPMLVEADIDNNGDEIILRRELLPSGRSRAFINDTPVNLATLGAVADRLVDIHSQHKNLLIADPQFQLKVIDSIADNAALLESYHIIYAQYRQALKEFADMRRSIDNTRADADYIKYQLDELLTLSPVAGEDDELNERRETLADSVDIATAVSDAGQCLAWGDANAIDMLDRAIEALQIASTDEVSALAARLEAVKGEVEAVASALESMAVTVGDAPEQIAQIDSRLGRLNTLMARHKVKSAAELAEIAQALTARLAALDDADTILGDLEAKARRLKRQALEAATVLSQRRCDTAAALAERITEEARPLGLPNLVVNIDVAAGKLNPDGIDTVDFRFAFNKNQEPQSIGATASGGEISRVMLTLKSILADSVNLPTIIFDEIDTGVSGDIAARMGAMMRRLSRSMQVLAITHLPAVAACGEHHFKVYKRDGDDATGTYITTLGTEERRHELAAMLGGRSDDPAALAAADSLLNNYQ